MEKLVTWNPPTGGVIHSSIRNSWLQDDGFEDGFDWCYLNLMFQVCIKYHQII